MILHPRILHWTSSVVKTLESRRLTIKIPEFGDWVQCVAKQYMYTDFQDILTEKNRKKSVLDQSNSKVWVQFVAKPGQKIRVVKELRCGDVILLSKTRIVVK